MQITRFDTTEQFVRAAASWISSTIDGAVSARGKAIVGLSGGSTPKPIYTMLATDQQIRWPQVTFFLTDERCVSPTDNDSNARMVRETLLTHEAQSATFVIPDTSLAPEACAAVYGKTVKDMGHPDLVILGMGDDAHIASLFPPLSPLAFGPTHAIHTTTDRFAVHDRISVTFPPLLWAEKRLFLITGKTKEMLLKKMQSDNEDVSLYPAQYLFDEKTTWMVGP